MNTYIKTEEGRFAAIRATRTEVSKLAPVVECRWAIVPATSALRRAAAINIEVKTLRILADGSVGYL